MAAVLPPPPSYQPNLPAAVIEHGKLSLAQLEAIVYAGQAHQQQLPAGERRGFFIGDGTGVGKGREIAGIMLDNFRSGRAKAVWISEKGGLMRDARRDYDGIGGDGALLFSQSKTKPADKIGATRGILFTSYSLLASSQKKKGVSSAAQGATKTRLQQVVDWLGQDFDGVIAFDESHNMSNVVEKRGARGMAPPAAKALAGVALQAALPHARIVYVSATGATEVSNLAYATRLGLWGEGTPFNNASDFTKSINAGGVAAMELISRDMKAMGVYIARSLSFDGVTYERLEHALTPLQIDVYNELAGAWQTVLSNVNAALSDTGQGKNGTAKSAALSRFWGAHQRFFNQVITAMQMPTVIENAQIALDAGHAVVMQLVNTNEAAQERQVSELARTGAEIDELDFTPRQNLIDYIKTGFPIQQYEEFKDDAGNIRSRPALDSEGRAITNREMEARRDALIDTLNTIRIPDNPIDMILNTFGPERVAEVTGRGRRFVLQRDGEGNLKTIEQKRPATAAAADADAFMADKKQVLVFSDAGGTGYSFHADLSGANQRKRIHYVVQPGWRADKAVQGMGRTHRTNEASQPHYILPTTNLEAQRRFISSIARRLDQLGALTKGQRQTGSLGLFSADDNLESEYARRALKILFDDMYHHRSPLDFKETIESMGLNGLVDQRTGAFNETKLPTIPQFLNRLLSLRTHEQDRVFNEFSRTMGHVIDIAKQQGTYDLGVETVRADSIEKMRDELVHTDQRTGAETHYVELAMHHPTHYTAFAELPLFHDDGTPQDGFEGFFRNERSSKIFALLKTGQGINEKGQSLTRGRQYQPTGPIRYVDNVEQVISAARGRITIKRMELAPAYAGAPFIEHWTRNGNTFEEHSDAAVAALRTGGIKSLEYMQYMRGIAPERRSALSNMVSRIKDNLKYEEVEREVNAYTRLERSEAEQAWASEIAAAPTTHVQRVHMITGALLPIWDRIPGTPRVIRTQTDAGERLLGRVVAPALLKQTLSNLCIAPDVEALSIAQVIEQVKAGAKGVLANGWELRMSKMGGSSRLEIVVPSMTGSDWRWLENQGMLVERIRWQSRAFIPTGELEPVVLQRLFDVKPLAELFQKNAEQDDGPAYSRARGAPDAADRAESSAQGGMSLASVTRLAQSIGKKWAAAPEVICVQSVEELPFDADDDARGAYYRDRVYLVADNLHDDAEVEFVLAHEVIGHLGLRTVLGIDRLATELERLRRVNPNLASLAAHLSAACGIPIAQATEEAMADLAASGARINGFQQFAQLVQRGLRKIGLKRVADWFEGKTQAETFSLIARARTAMQGECADQTAAPNDKNYCGPSPGVIRRPGSIQRSNTRGLA